jgi:hypothetical protein
VTRRLFFIMLLAYVALDLSLPEMPGAFVFDAADSVDTINAARVRATDKIAAPTPSMYPVTPLQLARSDGRDRLRPRSQATRPACAVVSYLPRGICASSPPSEDPH